ncbi:MAG TPA: rRNA pseudouridine synthase [Epulopiscium sp.]|nr:rRNA pseudouridine synthase [Candidatus Epulonipiscium sp.]
MRLQKFLAQAGVASRRKSEELILNGSVKVNNITITELGTKIDPDTDIVMYKDQIVKGEEKQVYYMLNKPVGYVTTVKDEKDRKTVLDLLHLVPERIYPVGRLDCDTSGLLLLTNDGDLTYLITHPKHEIEKTYIATVRGIPNNVQLDHFREGLIIDNWKTATAKISILNTNNNSATLSITIREGRNRQVRKMCAAIGTPVISLRRVCVGTITLGELDSGKYRPLTEKEINYLKNL